MSASEENPELAGTMVNARRRKSSDLPDLPEFGKVGYLSARDEEVALRRTKSSLFKLTPTDDIVATIPRAEVEGLELEERRGFARLRLRLTGERLWEFDVAGPHRGSAREFVEALGGRVTQPE